MTLRVRRLDSVGDMTFGHGAADFLVDSPEAVAQIIGTRLWLWRGEWFLDNSVGMPWLQDILGVRTLRLANSIIRGYIANSPGVQQVVKYTSDLVSSSRKFTAEATVDTIFGQIRLVQDQVTAPVYFQLDVSLLDGPDPLE